VFHAPQNLEKGGHGISPCTMHHLKSVFPGWKAFCFAHSLIVVEFPSKFSRSGRMKMRNLCADDADYSLTLDEWILIYALSLVLCGVSYSGQF
jgi:hypothetical protein